MTREEIKDLLVEIKSFYPRFALVDPDDYTVRSQTLDAWYDMIGFRDKEDCKRILQDYIAGPNGDKVPGISTFAGGRQGPKAISGNAYRINEVIHYRPDLDSPEKEIRVFWTGSAWIDRDGQLWAAPDEEHPELADNNFVWSGQGKFADRIRECMPRGGINGH